MSSKVGDSPGGRRRAGRRAAKRQVVSFYWEIRYAMADVTPSFRIEATIGRLTVFGDIRKQNPACEFANASGYEKNSHPSYPE